MAQSTGSVLGWYKIPLAVDALHWHMPEQVLNKAAGAHCFHMAESAGGDLDCQMVAPAGCVQGWCMIELAVCSLGWHVIVLPASVLG